jgi:DNA polymerase-3 subunit gamma/tau
VLDAVQAVADEDLPAAFGLAGRAVEMGYDLRLVCRELSRAVRDLLVLSVDPSRATDPEIVCEGERERLATLSKRFSREDLLRAFDVLTRAEADIRAASQPRYHLEMALLRWMYLKRLVPIEDLIAGSGYVSPAPSGSVSRVSAHASAPRAQAPPATADRARSSVLPVGQSGSAEAPDAARGKRTAGPDVSRGTPESTFKDELLGEVKKSKVVFYNTVVAQAQTIDVTADRITFTFLPGQRALRDALEQNRSWLESIALQVGKRTRTVVGVQSDAGASSPGSSEPPKEPDKKAALRQRALADAGVQALLEVFPAEIRDVEEI